MDLSGCKYEGVVESVGHGVVMNVGDGGKFILTHRERQALNERFEELERWGALGVGWGTRRRKLCPFPSFLCCPFPLCPFLAVSSYVQYTILYSCIIFDLC